MANIVLHFVLLLASVAFTSIATAETYLLIDRPHHLLCGLVAIIMSVWFGLRMFGHLGTMVVLRWAWKTRPNRDWKMGLPICGKQGCISTAPHVFQGSLKYNACELHVDEITRLVASE